jgi:hypothetical protein
MDINKISADDTGNLNHYLSAISVKRHVIFLHLFCPAVSEMASQDFEIPADLFAEW